MDRNAPYRRILGNILRNLLESVDQESTRTTTIGFVLATTSNTEFLTQPGLGDETLKTLLYCRRSKGVT